MVNRIDQVTGFMELTLWGHQTPETVPFPGVHPLAQWSMLLHAWERGLSPLLTHLFQLP